MNRLRYSALALGLALASFVITTGCGGSDPGTQCCDCLIENSCWDYGLCPSSQDCYCLYAEDEPSGCPLNACFAAGGTCYSETTCKEDCQEIRDQYLH